VKDALLRVYQARRDAVRARLAREEAVLRGLLRERDALKPAPLPEAAEAAGDLALYFRHEARKHREARLLQARIDEEADAVAALRALEQDRHRRLRAVERLLLRRERARRRTRALRAARDLEDLVARFREVDR